MPDQYQNLPAVLRCQAERLGPRPALRWKQHGLYSDLTWDAYRETVAACAAALIDVGVRPGERVGLLSENRLEWLLADMAIMSASAVNVPPHAPLTARQIAYQFADAGIVWLFVSNRAQLAKAVATAPELPGLKGIVVFDDIQTHDLASPVPVCSWPSFLQRGRQARLREEIERREQALHADSLATIMYTSGTTGNPKGVMLTHGNLLSNAAGIVAIEPHGPGDVVLSWLPYSHIYARTVDHYMQLVSGVLMCLAESAETVVANLDEVQPTHLAAVPRFYEKVLTAVAASDVTETQRRLRKLFGPRIQVLMSGGAPLPPPVAHAYHDAGLCVLQGYGLTETAPVITFNRRAWYKLETVGQPLPDIEVEIAADGEIRTRGPHVMQGYWNNPVATAESLRDGWFYTGDLGALDADGFLSITGRKKELLVLSNGKKVVPTVLEGLMVSDECIDQAVVYGEGRKFLTALIVPHWDNVRRCLHDAGVTLGAADDLTQHPAVCSLLRNRIEQALAEVSNWEQVRKIVVLQEPFSIANDELTVSMKLRRNVVLEKHRARLEQLYKE